MKRKVRGILLLFTFAMSVAVAQQRKLSGTVTSVADNRPIVGATILLQGTASGTQTDANGKFSIAAALGATLVVKNVGYKQKSVAVNAEHIDIILEPDESTIEEVAVIGYGSAVPLSSVVGAISQVSSDAIKDRPTANALEALQGRVAGVQVFTSNGEPSATQSVRVRGVGSLSSSSTPLYVIDGIPVNNTSIVALNPQDFESMTVLKDASATSIYGSRAANGVIYITTKKGKKGEHASITLRSQYGWSNLANTEMQENLMSTDELLNFWQETGYRTQEQVDQIRADFPNNTQWYKYYYHQNIPMQQHDIDISGGSDKTTYFLSSSYYKQDGLMYRSGYDRYTFRSNIDSRLKDWLRIGLNASAGYNERETNAWGSNSTNGGLGLLAQPFYTPYDENGNEYYGELIPGWGRYSPRYLADVNPITFGFTQFNPTGYIEIKPFKGLIFKTQAGMDLSMGRMSSRVLPSFVGSLGNGSGTEGYYQTVYKTWTNTLEYTWSINKHNFKVLGGQEYVDNDYTDFVAAGGGLADDRMLLLSSAPNNRTVSQNRNQFAYSSFFGRLSYNFSRKYSLDVSVRQDQSSRFGINNRSATFWSVGGLWDVKSEAFLADVDWIANLKIRSSIGTSGNSEIGNYTHLATVGTGFYGGGTAWGITAPGNPSLSWEKQTMFNAGFSSRLFGFADIDFDYYIRTTNDMLVQVPYPYTSGFSQIWSNVGALQNKGFDLSLSFDLIKDKDYYIAPYLTYNYNSERVTSLFQGNDYWVIPGTGVAWALGQPISYFYPVNAGVDPQTGLSQWYVPGENIAVTQTDPNNVSSTFNQAALQQNTGIRRYPPHNGGFGLNAGYRGFSLQAHFAFSKGKYLINNDRYFYENPYLFAGFNQSNKVLDYWQQPGDNSAFPKYGEILQFDSGLVEDASFLRMKTLQIGYSLPKKMLDRSRFFQAVRLFYMGRNLFTATKFSGPDPEVDSNLTLGVNPNTKQHTIGLEIQF